MSFNSYIKRNEVSPVKFNVLVLNCHLTSQLPNLTPESYE